MKNCIKNKETNVLPLGGMYKRILLQHSTKKFFSNFIRPFLVNKGSLNSSEIMLRKGKKIITDTKEIVQVLNGHYINIAERSCWEKLYKTFSCKMTLKSFVIMKIIPV